MNKAISPYRRFVIILLWLLLICLAVHFLNDLQTGRVDLMGSVIRVCNNAIHSGLLAVVISPIILMVLALKLLFMPRLFSHSGFLPVPILPPK
ncbi:MAG: hypothetical protein M1281_04315 [Chloroflexi bacterium]|nr:hypothetical protein [Chloroflexota bacterium]